jgi:hypothetical protein
MTRELAVGIIIVLTIGIAWALWSLRTSEIRIRELMGFRARDSKDLGEAHIRLGLFTAELEDVGAQLRDTQEALRSAISERQDWARRAEEYRLLNESVLKQKEQWMLLYDRQAIAHGNAQVWMLETIEGLAGQLRAHGIKVAVPPVVRQAHEMFLVEHVNPVLERTGTETVHRGNLVPSVGTTLEGKTE